jgi:murein DD-endopeptidase MepM/ murein hydrolase activator NlpD
MDFNPPQVKQGHTLLIQIGANRPISVTGAFDEHRLHFVPQPTGAWTVAGVPVTAAAGAHPVQFSIVDSLGTRVSTTVSVTVQAAEFGQEQISVPPLKLNLLDPAIAQEDAQRLEQTFADITPQQLWQGTFVQPYIGPVSSPFGMYRTYNGGQRSYHSGIDLAGTEGAPVVAASNGRVALAAPLKVHGNTVVLDHGWGVFSAYYHLSQILVQEGQKVVQGEKVGLVGNTGLSTGPHLHWEIRVGSVPVDPLEWTARTFP